MYICMRASVAWFPIMWTKFDSLYCQHCRFIYFIEHDSCGILSRLVKFEIRYSLLYQRNAL